MRFIDEIRPRFGVEPTCAALGVPTSTYYARRLRGTTTTLREERDAKLLGEIRYARRGYRSCYGVRKTWKQLKRDDVGDVGRERVARIMRREAIRGVRRGRRRFLTVADKAAERARDLVERDFTATRPNELWVADITYLRSDHGFVYLAFILDVYSRMIVGWQIATHLRASLVIDALEMATTLRGPDLAGLISHTDRGSQYTSLAYTDRCEEYGIAPSVGRVGTALDNAMAESFVATFKSELVDHHHAGRPFRSFEHAEHETLAWIGFYNHDRLHGELDDQTPAESDATRPSGPPEPAQPAQPEGALTGLG